MNYPICDTCAKSFGLELFSMPNVIEQKCCICGEMALSFGPAPKILNVKGRPVQELTRVELIKLLVDLVREIRLTISRWEEYEDVL